jgi:WbqC-like protein family
MRLGIMQPYFFPYIGYFQLINSVDEFVVYDNIEFTKKGWINRNRILVNGKDEYITLPLKRDSDYLFVKDRFLADTWEIDKKKLINRIFQSYKKAPYIKDVIKLVEDCIFHDERNLFNFIYYSLNQLKKYFQIDTTLLISSTIEIDHNLKSEEKVIAYCKAKKASHYINPSGGLELYDKEKFKENGIELKFLKSKNLIYTQFKNDFVPSLSIIDTMMFNSREVIGDFLNNGYILL